MDTIESLFDRLGGMGKFQVMTTLTIALCQIPIGCSVFQMSFTGVVPDFHCLVNDVKNTTDSHSHDGAVSLNIDNFDQNRTGTLQHYSNKTLNACSINGTSCNSYVFEGSLITAVTEWGLVCDMAWVKKIMISLQMAGVLVGVVIAGQIGDLYGRKKSAYSCVFFHMILNIVAAFSVNWIMFACLRFLIGMCIGAILLIICAYKMEFLPTEWRTLATVIPTFSLGIILFAGAAAYLENWAHLHIFCAALTIFGAPGVLIVPESPRWLAVQGRLDDAQNVIKRMAAMNKKAIPENTLSILESIQGMEREYGAKTRNYTYLDLFKTIFTAKASFVGFYYWFSFSVLYYGISFGVGNLAGNIFINIVAFGAMDFPAQLSVFVLNKKFGRRKTALFYYILCLLSLIACLVLRVTATGAMADTAINALSIVSVITIGSVWTTVQIWGSELFPTVIRNLGNGFISLGARIGAILAPFIVDLEEGMSRSYGILCGMVAFGILLLFVLPETKGKCLNDSMKPSNNFVTTVDQVIDESVGLTQIGQEAEQVNSNSEGSNKE